MPIIGIDFGNTSSRAAVLRGGNLQLIPNAAGEYATPTVVSIDENESVLVGQAAKKRLLSHPHRTASGFKHLMGTNTPFPLAGMAFTPIDLAAFILHRLKLDAEAFLDTTVKEIVISVPASFDENARNAVRAAAELADLHVAHIINEPSAAALAHRQIDDDDLTLLILDLSGQTFDAAVVDAFSDVIEIISIASDQHLGGDDFDAAIFRRFLKENSLIESELPASIHHALLDQAQQCKIALSASLQTAMTVQFSETQHTLLLNHQKLSKICTPLLRQMEAPLARALRDCQTAVNEIDDIILVGAAGRMPLVQHYLHHILGKPAIAGETMDCLTVHGAAIYASVLEQFGDQGTLRLPDICPTSIGLGITSKKDGEELFSPMIERNTPLPASRVRTYFTTSDRQTVMNIGIYRGEEIDCRDNQKIGSLQVSLPSDLAGEQGVEVRFTYDLDGILQVEATCQSTGEKSQLQIVHPYFALNEEDLSTHLAALEECKKLPRDETENKALLARASRLYTESTGLLREQIHQQINYFNLLLREDIKPKLRRYRQELSMFFDQIDEHLGSDDEILRSFRESYDLDSYDEEEEP